MTNDASGKINPNMTIPMEGNGSRPSHFGNGYGNTGDPMFTLNGTEVHSVAYKREVINEREKAE